MTPDFCVEALTEAIEKYGTPVYLHAYESAAEARDKLGTYLNFFNRLRPYSSLDRQTPDMVRFTLRPHCVECQALISRPRLYRAEPIFMYF